MFLRLISDDGKTVLSSVEVERRTNPETKRTYLTAGPLGTPPDRDGFTFEGHWNGNRKNHGMAQQKAAESILASAKSPEARAKLEAALKEAGIK